MDKILLCTFRWPVARGGTAIMARLTAKAFADRGYDVTVLTQTDDGSCLGPNIHVVNQPSLWRTIWEIFRADYVICEGACLRLCWPLLFIPKKSIVVKHMITKNTTVLRRVLEKWLSLNCKWAAVSKFVARNEYVQSVVVPNAYDPSVFFNAPGERVFDIVFLGCVKEEKGVMVLARAIMMLLDRGVRINRVTIIGSGPDAERMSGVLASAGKFNCEVVFVGQLGHKDVAKLLRQHVVLVAPTINNEAFGLIAIEGLACGCKVVVSDSGGLPEAVDDCGLVSACGDAEDLARCIERALDPMYMIDDRKVKEHLGQYTAEKLVDSYMAVMG